MDSRIVGYAVALLLNVAALGHAQTIRGRVFMPDSATPVAGIVVTAIAENGKAPAVR